MPDRFPVDSPTMDQECSGLIEAEREGNSVFKPLRVPYDSLCFLCIEVGVCALRDFHLCCAVTIRYDPVEVSRFWFEWKDSEYVFSCYEFSARHCRRYAVFGFCIVRVVLCSDCELVLSCRRACGGQVIFTVQNVFEKCRQV